MPHDKRGEELKVGDTVMVPCRIKAIHLTEDYCNVDLETTLTMPPLGHATLVTLNSRQTIKPTATHRFAEYPPAAPVVRVGIPQEDKHEEVATRVDGQPLATSALPQPPEG